MLVGKASPKTQQNKELTPEQQTLTNPVGFYLHRGETQKTEVEW